MSGGIQGDKGVLYCNGEKKPSNYFNLRGVQNMIILLNNNNNNT